MRSARSTTMSLLTRVLISLAGMLFSGFWLLLVFRRYRAGEPFNSVHLPTPDEGSWTWRIQYWGAFAAGTIIFLVFAATPFCTPL